MPVDQPRDQHEHASSFRGAIIVEMDVAKAILQGGSAGYLTRRKMKKMDLSAQRIQGLTRGHEVRSEVKNSAHRTRDRV